MPRLSDNQEVPVAISNLRLCNALRECGRLGVENAFDKSTAAALYVYDDNTLGYSDWNSEEPEFVSKTFRADNPDNTWIILLPLDNRIITGPEIVKGGICDCALLTEREMSFVEFKTDSRSGNYLTIQERSDEAIRQLWHTFDNVIRPRCEGKIKRNIVELVNVDFYVVFDKNLDVTNASAVLQEKAVDFLQRNKFKLFFNNDKAFI